LKKGDNLKQINYTTAPLYFSDHRPVYATFQCTISHVDGSVKDRLSQEIYENRRSQLKKITTKARGASIKDDVIEYESIASELPVASSDRGKWWLDDGKGSPNCTLWGFPNSNLTDKGLAARSNLEAPNKDSIPNPDRSSNPFSSKSESDWVVVPKVTATEVEGVPRPVNRKPIVGYDSTVPRQTNMKPRPLSHVSRDTAQALTVEHDQRRGTSALTSSRFQEWGVTRKPAPPVPRKPPILTSSDSNISRLGGAPSSVPGILVRRTEGVQMSTLPSENAKFQGTLARTDRPLFPSSRASSVQRDIPEGLLDKANEDACLIPTIQPIRRQS
jgi:hypothetical protein